MPISPSIPATRVILVRHGRSTYNEQGLYQGASDNSVLTATGHQDAYRTGLALQETPLAAIYTSPLKRTRQTTQAIQAAVRARPPVKIAPCLQEIYLPEWEGLAYRHVRDVMRDRYQCWIDHPDQFQMTAPLSGHPLEHLNQNGVIQSFRKIFPVRQLYQQAQYFWRRILPHHTGETILVVSHGGTIRALIDTALGVPCQHYHKLQQSNCGISMLEFSALNPAHLNIMNDTYHLDEVLPKVKEGKQGLRLILVPAGDVTDIRRLQTQIEPLEIQFCLSNGDRAQIIADQIFCDRPNVLQLQSPRSDAHQCWLQSLQQQNPDHDSLLTGMMIANPQNLQAMVGQLMGADATLPLTLESGCFSVLHFPTSRKAPVLQALNFGQGVKLNQPISSGAYYPCAS